MITQINDVRVITPPSFEVVNPYRITLFLAGSIEMNKAEEWQKLLINKIVKEVSNKKIDIYNPRRENWDISIKQSIEDPAFYQQVRWELDYLENAKYRVFYFAPDTLSPISLLEYGKFYTYPNTSIVVHPDYQRAGNLEVFCNKYGIIIHRNFDDLIYKLKWS